MMSELEKVLPTECIIHTFSFLEDRKLCEIAGVSKTWKALSSDSMLWHALYLRRWQDKAIEDEFLLEQELVPRTEEDEATIINWKIKYLSRRSHHWKKGIPLFNKNAAEGIKFLVSERKLDDNPKSISDFLLSFEGLNKYSIGQYLGDHPEVFRCFLSSFNLAEKFIDQAFRIMLKHMRLPASSSLVDNIFSVFGQVYYEQNIEAVSTSSFKAELFPFQSAEVVYIVAFSMYVLNTDLHNNLVKKKMTKQEFVRNCHRIEDTASVPQSYLEDLYKRLKKNPLVQESDRVSSSSSKTKTSKASRSEKKKKKREKL